MKQTRFMMGMPIVVEIAGRASKADFEAIFDYFAAVDRRFSPYKEDSEVAAVNRGLPEDQWSAEMKEVMKLCEQTKRETDGYFDVWHNGRYDPSGLVKGWAINNAAQLLAGRGHRNYYVEAGGDIQVKGHNSKGQAWQLGIRSPFKDEVIKTVRLTGQGMATSGDYLRGKHVYNPHQPEAELSGLASLTVIGPNIYEADRFATAAYAMGLKGLQFLESLDDFEAYGVDNNGMATYTSGFDRYVYA